MNTETAGKIWFEAIDLINQEGQVIDIKQLVVQFDLYESIYNKFVTARMVIGDGINLLKNYRVNGQEFIRISCKMDDGEKVSDAPYSIDKTFQIHKIHNVKRKGVLEVYEVELVSPRQFYTLRSRISRSYRGTYNDILVHLLTKEGSFKVDEFDYALPTSPEVQFIVPNWTIDKTVDFICQQADSTSAEGDGAPAFHRGFFFFQSLNGGFRFMDIDGMMKLEQPATFTYGITQDKENPKDKNFQIIDFHNPQLFDTLEGTRSGTYSGRQMTYDPILKLEMETHHDIGEVYNRKNHLGQAPMIRTTSKTNGFFETTKTTGSGGDSIELQTTDANYSPNKSIGSALRVSTKMVHAHSSASEYTSDESIASYDSGADTPAGFERNAMHQILAQHRLEVTVPFRTDLTVGTVVNLIIPSGGSGLNSVDDGLNDHRYLIIDLRVAGDPTSQEGITVMGVCKESYAKRIEDVNPLLLRKIEGRE